MVAVFAGPPLGIEQPDHILPVEAGVDVPLTQKQPVQDLPGLGQVILVGQLDQAVMLEHFVQGIEERRGDLVAHRQRLEPVQAGVFQLVDGAPPAAFDENAFVLIDDPAVVRMLVHHVDADPLLLVFVQAEAGGQLLQALGIPLGDGLVPEVEVAKAVVEGLVLFMDEL